MSESYNQENSANIIEHTPAVTDIRPSTDIYRRTEGYPFENQIWSSCRAIL